MDEKIGRTASLSKMFPTVLGLCDEVRRGKVRNRANFDYLESSGDTLSLLKAINRRDTEYKELSTPLLPIIRYRSSSTALSRVETVASIPCPTTSSTTLTWSI